jgi:hypothetical protein
VPRGGITYEGVFVAWSITTRPPVWVKRPENPPAAPAFSAHETFAFEKFHSVNISHGITTVKQILEWELKVFAKLVVRPERKFSSEKKI